MTRASLPVLAVGLPGALVAIWSLGLGLMTLVGANPYWTPQPVNISEAAALRDAATVVRLLRRGADPREPQTLRAGTLFERAVTMNPLEAAVAARRAEVVDAILAERPHDPGVWTIAACLARSVEDEDVRGVVVAHRPDRAVPEPDCAGYTRPW